MKRSHRPRKTAELSEPLHQQLTMYALAASAAGVGVLALAQPAEAKIVYSPADKHIRVNGGIVNLDLNHDGITDVIFHAGYVRNGSDFFGSLWLAPRSEFGGAMKVVSRNLYCVAALPNGHKIGMGQRFLVGTAEEPMASGGGVSTLGSSSGGPWRFPTKRGYVGLKFAIKGKIHFGWVRVERVASKRFHYPAVITGYAYETIPGKAIIAGATEGPDDAEPTASLRTRTPQPVTLGALALGASGLSIWRREESVVDTSGK